MTMIRMIGKTFSIERPAKLFPIRSKTRKPSLIARIVEHVWRSARRIGVWSEDVHWATVADAIFFSVFMLSLFVLYWLAYLMGWYG